MMRDLGATEVVLDNGTVVRFSGRVSKDALRSAQARAELELAQARKAEIKGAVAAPEKSAEDKVDVDPLLSPELRAQLEADRVSQLMVDDPFAYETYQMDSMIERERQLGTSDGSAGGEK